jgi:hypothetical protein
MSIVSLVIAPHIAVETQTGMVKSEVKPEEKVEKVSYRETPLPANTVYILKNGVV